MVPEGVAQVGLAQPEAEAEAEVAAVRAERRKTLPLARMVERRTP